MNVSTLTKGLLLIFAVCFFYFIDTQPNYASDSDGILLPLLALNNNYPSETLNYTTYNKSIDDMCNISESILFGSHHKTGTFLLHSISEQVRKYINNRVTNCSKPLQRTVHMKYLLEAYYLDPFIAQNIEHKYIIHCIRHPADTILSAYNYHKGASPELWFAAYKIKDLKQRGEKHLTEFRRRDNRFGESRRMICVADMFEKYFPENPYLNMTIKQMLRSIHISDGIYFEYLRYFECEFAEISRSTRIVADSSNVIGLNVFLEEFEQDFNQTCIKILKCLNIEYDKKLLEGLNSLNVYKDIKVKIGESPHITTGTFNKTQQLQILLGDLQRCNALKNMSHVIKATWKYDMFC